MSPIKPRPAHGDLTVSLDLFASACSDMRRVANQFADAYANMHTATFEMANAWQRMNDGLGRVEYGRESATLRTRARLQQDLGLETIDRYTSLKKLLDQENAAKGGAPKRT